MNKVFIPCAGLGSRLVDLTKNYNKAMVSLGHKPLISYIIEHFTSKTEFVIALGYKGNLLKEFLIKTYPNFKFNFVNISTFRGSGASLGLTILSCEKYLNERFIFCACDSISKNKLKKCNENWVGVSNSKVNLKHYRSIKRNQKFLDKIYPKNSNLDALPYIGIAGIKSYKEFWYYLKNTNIQNFKMGEIYSINQIAKNTKVHIRKFDWIDGGNLKDLTLNQNKFLSTEINILPKDNENIWFVNGKVIKYSKNKTFISERVSRAKKLYPFVPKIISYSDNMYAYKFIKGSVFSKNPNIKSLNNLLIFCKKFWKNQKNLDLNRFYEDCYNFYYNKTLDRIRQFNSKNKKPEKIKSINNICVEKINFLMNQINWDNLQKGIPVRFHGDLHFENIIVTYKNHFKFLDWRQNFSGNLLTGDIYYDLAKIYHGIIVSHEQVKSNNFYVNYIDENKVNIKININKSLRNCEQFFRTWILENNYDLEKVITLTSLIYINIAPLHHYPYNEFLYYLGKLILTNEKNKNEISLILNTFK